MCQMITDILSLIQDCSKYLWGGETSVNLCFVSAGLLGPHCDVLSVHFRTFEYREEPQSVRPFHQHFERSLGPRRGQSSPVQALLRTHSRRSGGTGTYFL